MENNLTKKNNYDGIGVEVSKMKKYNDVERDKLQKNLSVIRKVAGWTCADLGELIGVTKQTINNLESSRTPMTKTQYIAIRAILDYEISSNQENLALAQVVKILLDSEQLTEEEQLKVDTTVTYVTGAKEKGMSNAAIATGLTALVAALGLGVISGPLVGSTVGKATMPLWLEAIVVSKKKK